MSAASRRSTDRPVLGGRDRRTLRVTTAALGPARLGLLGGAVPAVRVEVPGTARHRGEPAR